MHGHKFELAFSSVFKPSDCKEYPIRIDSFPAIPASRTTQEINLLATASG